MNPTGPLTRSFQQAGLDLYLVGGPVRDRILGRPVHDLDFTTPARPDRIKLLARRAGATSIYTVGERFGTIGAVFGDQAVEITTFRSESYRPDSRKPAVQFGNSLEADLGRRDFTINAIAQNTLTGRISDPHGGLDDLTARRIRAVGTATKRFREDPLRVLRCVRFAAQLGFDIDPSTLAAAQSTVAELRIVSSERIGAELNLILLSPRPDSAVRALLEIGVLGRILPELIPLQYTAPEAQRQHKDFFAHTLHVLATVPPQPRIRWAALLHEIGKPKTKSTQDRRGARPPNRPRTGKPRIKPKNLGRVTFHGSEDVAAHMATAILRRLKFDSRLTSQVTRIILLHTRTNSYESDWTDGAVRRFILDAGEDLPALIALSRADITSQRPQRIKAGLVRVAELQARCEQLQAEDDPAALDSPLDGHALMELFDRPPGVWIQPIKQYLLDLVLDGELEPDDVERARILARGFVQRHTSVADAVKSGARRPQATSAATPVSEKSGPRPATSAATDTHPLLVPARDQKRRGAWYRKVLNSLWRAITSGALLIRQMLGARGGTDTPHARSARVEGQRAEQREDRKSTAQRPIPQGQSTRRHPMRRPVQDAKDQRPSVHAQRTRPQPKRLADHGIKGRKSVQGAHRKRSRIPYWPPKRPWPPHWR